MYIKSIYLSDFEVFKYLLLLGILVKAEKEQIIEKSYKNSSTSNISFMFASVLTKLF